jgi:hypothetical protein
MSVKASPASLRAKASAIWNCDSLGFLPNLTPLAIALVQPSLVLAKIKLRSNSASPPRIVIISFPCAVVVSAQASAIDRNPVPALPTASRTLSIPRLETLLSASDRSSRQTRIVREYHPNLDVAEYHPTL